MTATCEGSSFSQLLTRVDLTSALLILDKETDLLDQDVRGKLGPPRLVCGGHPAFVPDGVSGEEREAATMYLDFLTIHCEGTPTR
jgi:hypothetical protein